ncbi:MAG: hypothetical protein ACOYMU_09300 [Phycisphaerales bacterium]
MPLVWGVHRKWGGPLAAADGKSHVAIDGDPCADIDGNGIRDGADEVLRAISITSECGPTTGH